MPVHSTGVAFGPDCIVPEKCTLPLAWLPSVHEDSTVPMPFIFPLHTMTEVMLLAFIMTLVNWQLGSCDTGAPYLSIMAWVRQTCVVVVVPLKGDFMLGGSVMPGGKGDFCQVMLAVISHKPGFIAACAEAKSDMANKQLPIMIKTRNLRMISPIGLRWLMAAHAYTLSQCA